GGDAWLSIDLSSGELLYEHTDRGWIAWLNDLHKGRNTGTAWAWFIDVFAVACLVFCITGLFLLHLHGRQRPATWPLVGFGLVAPLLLIILFIHSCGIPCARLFPLPCCWPPHPPAPPNCPSAWIFRA